VSYQRRIVDDQLDLMLDVLPAVAVEGAKGVGKTATGLQRATSVYSLDDRATAVNVADNPGTVTHGSGTVFVDEWQNVPDVWNVIRQQVDGGAPPGRFLLAGSANPRPEAKLHSGAGRIVRLLMRPLTLPERRIETPTVSLGELLKGEQKQVKGQTKLTDRDYIEEIFASGFPGIRSAKPAARPYLLRSYIDRIVDHDVKELGTRIRRPESLRGWLASYGAATATTTSYASLLNVATPGQDEKPNKNTAVVYRDLLQRMWVLDPLPAWVPSSSHLQRLGQAPKHHLVDPALAAYLNGVSPESLIRGDGPNGIRRDGTFLGALFESLAVQTIRVLAEANEARPLHFRMRGGVREVDIILERPDRRVIAVEVKLSDTVRPADVANLNWLEEATQGLVVDKVVVNAGSRAFRRPDGVAVVPLGLLGV